MLIWGYLISHYKQYGLKPVQFNQVCKCMAYIGNLIMQRQNGRLLPLPWWRKSAPYCIMAVEFRPWKTCSRQKLVFFCLKTTHFRICKASSKKDIQDRQISNNVFNIYCLRKKCKNGIYTHNAFNQEGTKDTWATTEKTQMWIIWDFQSTFISNNFYLNG